MTSYNDFSGFTLVAGRVENTAVCLAFDTVDFLGCASALIVIFHNILHSAGLSALHIFAVFYC